MCLRRLELTRTCLDPHLSITCLTQEHFLVQLCTGMLLSQMATSRLYLDVLLPLANLPRTNGPACTAFDAGYGPPSSLRLPFVRREGRHVVNLNLHSCIAPHELRGSPHGVSPSEPPLASLGTSTTCRTSWLPQRPHAVTRGSPRRSSCRCRGSLRETSGVSGGVEVVVPPPADYNHKQEVLERSRLYVREHYPDLLDLVEEGTLLAVERPPDYVERRSDGYCEPEVVLLVGTAHMSRKSARDVDRVIRSVRPENVVVELCRSSREKRHPSPVSDAGALRRTCASTICEWDCSAKLDSASAFAGHSDDDVSALERGAAWKLAEYITRGVTCDDNVDSWLLLVRRPAHPFQLHALGLLPSLCRVSAIAILAVVLISFSALVAFVILACVAFLVATWPPSAPPICHTSQGRHDEQQQQEEEEEKLPRDGDGATATATATAGAPPQQRGKNLMSLSGDNFASAMGRSLQLGGRSALALRLLLAGVAQKVSASAGVQSGEELKRAWAALSWREKLRLCQVLLQGATSARLDASEEALRALESDDALFAMFAEMGTRFPSLLLPLVHERDVYLAWSLKRSKAVNGTARVVGVMGRGHLRGVVYALTHNQEKLRFKDLVGSRHARGSPGGGREGPSPAVSKFLRNLLIETAVGGALWLLYTAATSPHS
eukprot:jgi/Mesen1/7030/ME000366S06236